MKWSLAPVSGPLSEPLHLNEAKNHLRETGTAQDAYISLLVKSARKYAEQVREELLVVRTFDMKLDEFPDGESISIPVRPLVSVSSVSYVDENGDSQTVASGKYTVRTEEFSNSVDLAYDQSWPTTREQPDAVTVRFIAGILTPFTSAGSGETLTLKGRTMSAGEHVLLSNSGGETRALPAPLAETTDYYVVNPSGFTVELSATSGGAAITLTSAGTGIHFMGEFPEQVRHAMLMLIGHWYEHREPVVVGESVSNVPIAVQALLDIDRFAKFA